MKDMLRRGAAPNRDLRIVLPAFRGKRPRHVEGDKSRSAGAQLCHGRADAVSRDINGLHFQSP